VFGGQVFLFSRSPRRPPPAKPQAAVPDHIQKAAQRAQQAAALRRAHEAAVAPGRAADAALLAAYLAYIKLEETHGDPARVQVRCGRFFAALALSCLFVYRSLEPQTNPTYALLTPETTCIKNPKGAV
jgi:hypothetical protein